MWFFFPLQYSDSAHFRSPKVGQRIRKGHSDPSTQILPLPVADLHFGAAPRDEREPRDAVSHAGAGGKEKEQSGDSNLHIPPKTTVVSQKTKPVGL